MKEITIKINEKDMEKFLWMLSHFNEIEIEEEEHIDEETIKRVFKYSNDYKSGRKEEFEELDV